MKILLVSPSQYDLYGALPAPDYPALGLVYLDAVLKRAGHQVDFMDLQAEKDGEKEFTAILKGNQYGFVGITATTPTINKAIKLAKLVKSSSSASTLLGGIHPTLMPQEILEHSEVDAVVRGEGEETVLELARRLDFSRDFSGIKGVSYRFAGDIIHNPERDLIQDLDSLPFPTRALAKNYDYIYPDALHKPVYPIITSRGCPGECSFCSVHSVFKRKFRTRSPENVVDEIEYLVKKLNAREIHIWDDNFITNRKRVFQIRDEIKRRNIKVFFSFPNGLRVDYINEEVVRALKEMGTYSLAYGVESGNQGILDKINKKTTLEMAEMAFNLARKYKIETWAFFIIGIPGEDKASIMDTIKFAKKINPDVAKFHILKPFPGTRTYRELKSAGLILDYGYDNYGIHQPPVHRLPGLDAQALLKLQRLAYHSFYLRPQVILKHLIRAKSFGRLYFNFRVGFSFLFKSK